MIDLTVLGIDTSSKTASCAIERDGLILAETTVYTSLTHSQVILPFVKRLFDDSGLTLDDISLIAVSAGPGSYTGLRIGIALVKGLCFGGKKCVGVSTLEALAANCISAKQTIFSVMSARPGIVYFGARRSDGEKLFEIVPDCVTETCGLKEIAASIEGDIILTGDAAEKIKSGLFSDEARVSLAPPAQRLQRASGVCLAAMRHLGESGDAQSLRARYLQITKAEKDLKEGKITLGSKS